MIEILVVVATPKLDRFKLLRNVETEEFDLPATSEVLMVVLAPAASAIIFSAAFSVVVDSFCVVVAVVVSSF